MNDMIHRRTVLKTVGTAAMTTAVAGCSGGGGGGDSTDGGESSDSDDGENDGSDGNSSDQYLASEPDYDGWFADVDNYEQTLDLTGQETVTISVGTGNTGILFDPPAVAVDPGTTIQWEWTGEGGLHNVAGENREFESETVDEQGYTFEETLSEPGIVRYVCTPHRALGMKGAVVIQDS